MYICPECRSTNVVVCRTARMIEYWSGDDVESEEDLRFERDYDDTRIECSECGLVGEHAEEWLA